MKAFILAVTFTIVLCTSVLTQSLVFEDYSLFFTEGRNRWLLDKSSVEYRGKTVFFWSVVQNTAEGTALFLSTELNCKTGKNRFWKTVGINIVTGKRFADGRRTSWFNQDHISQAMIEELCSAEVLVPTKNQTSEQREKSFRHDIAKAKWVFFAKDEEDNTYHIDSQNMSRFMSVVVFATKKEKRGTIEYNKMVGGCTKDVLSVSIIMISNPGLTALIGGEIEEP